MKRLMACAVLAALWSATAHGQEPLSGAPFNYSKILGLPYAQRANERTLRMNLFVPKTKGPHPVVLVLRGGGWLNPLPFDVMAKTLAAEGLASASISMRTARSDPHPAQRDDVQRAIQYLRHRALDHALDPKRIGILGLSSGGHLGALAAVMNDGAQPGSEDAVARQSTRVSCVVTMSAPLAIEGLDPTSVSQASWDLLRCYAGFPRGMKPEQATPEQATLLKQVAPAFHVTPDDPPFLIIHERQDPLVSSQHATLMRDALNKVEVPCECLVLDQVGHSAYLQALAEHAKDRSTETPEFWARIRVFLKKHLLAKDPVQKPEPESQPGNPGKERTPR